jgi:hypothetical protein
MEAVEAARDRIQASPAREEIRLLAILERIHRRMLAAGPDKLPICVNQLLTGDTAKPR